MERMGRKKEKKKERRKLNSYKIKQEKNGKGTKTRWDNDKIERKQKTSSIIICQKLF